MIVALNEEKVVALFEESSHQVEVVEGLYKMVYPDYSDIKELRGWPTVNNNTSNKLFKLFMRFDRKHHPEVVAGGRWMNNGFSCLKGKHLADWEVDKSTAKVIYR